MKKNKKYCRGHKFFFYYSSKINKLLKACFDKIPMEKYSKDESFGELDYLK